MTWKRFAVVVWFCFVQAGHAEELVSLLNPWMWVDYYENSGWKSVVAVKNQKVFKEDTYKFLDGNRSTYLTFNEGWNRYRGYQVIIEYSARRSHFWNEEPRPTHYRITMPAHVPEEDYPTSWTLDCGDYCYPADERIYDNVTDAVFKDGVYEGTMKKLRYLDYGRGYVDYVETLRLIFERTRGPKVKKTLSIADFELLGPREELDALWPYGKFPCSKRFVPVPRSEFAKVFTKPAVQNTWRFITKEETLLNVFDASFRDYLWMFIEFDKHRPRQPIIIGAIFRHPILVNELLTNMSASARKIVVQGSLCQPHCRKYGSRGWVTLARHYRATDLTISIQTPGEYKGYRLKLFKRFPEKRGIRSRRLPVQPLFFTHCPN